MCCVAHKVIVWCDVALINSNSMSSQSIQNNNTDIRWKRSFGLRNSVAFI